MLTSQLGVVMFYGPTVTYDRAVDGATNILGYTSIPVAGDNQ